MIDDYQNEDQWVSLSFRKVQAINMPPYNWYRGGGPSRVAGASTSGKGQMSDSGRFSARHAESLQLQMGATLPLGITSEVLYMSTLLLFCTPCKSYRNLFKWTTSIGGSESINTCLVASTSAPRAGECTCTVSGCVKWTNASSIVRT
jgi:hypothetical protein